ncbi:MAG TPA: PSD1 and planctomycete cytochrome C domain-containing protein, partial [Gemmataceae bacterium]|nr:PSD1 and planctomycete cytochrome C domain-containing protein [Gemmataceae bacterium]
MRNHHGTWGTWALPVALALAVPPARAESAPRFEQDVRPVLAAHCLRCHGEGKKPKAGLDLRTPAAMLRGGESGPALVPGSAEKSLFLQMIRKGEMPPKSNPRLTAAEIDLLRRWIDAGAPGTRTTAAVDVAAARVTEQDRQFWAFRKPVRPAVPRVRDVGRVRTPIDTFVLARLEAKGLTFSPDADPATLVRRAYLDLLGLPPSPAEVDAYLSDPRPDAYERLVDRLLASPHYGERWGRHWLDAAGYADSIGGDNDPGQVFPREGMWRYRDYVVRSLNADKPYDRFLTEQLAGDEMDDWRSAPVFTPEMREHLIATGFLRTTVDHTFEDELNRPFERYQVLHDTIENVTTNLLGLTVACARCHDHKFDPIAQVEYYRLLAVLKPVYNPEAWIKPQNRHLDDVSPREKEAIERHNRDIDRQVAERNRKIVALRQPYERRLAAAKLAAVPEAIRADTEAALATPAEKRGAVQKYLAAKLGTLLQVSPGEVTRSLNDPDRAAVTALEQQVAALKAQRQSVGTIQAAWEAGQGTAPPTYLFRRGNLVTPGAEVQPALFAVLTDPGRPLLIGLPKPGAKSSGRRTAWARWLTRPDHPLTARVFVNRTWQRYFGEGIVATSDNFGHLGARPTHPKLLDWLATEFVSRGWKIKALHRLIVTSTVYRQSSTAGARPAGAPDPEAVDPGDQLLWRQRLRRLESEVIRDSVLAVSGTLDTSMGGPPVPITPLPDGLVVVPAQGLPTPTARWRRSLYLFSRRNYNLTLLNVFDQPVMATNCTRRITSAVPLQSLTLLNDAVMLE